MSTTKFLCITSCSDFMGRSLNRKKLEFAILSLNSAHYSLPVAPGKFISFAAFRRSHQTVSYRVSTPVSVKTYASLTGGLNYELEASSDGLIRDNDLLIVGPGVLGRIVAEKWLKEHPESRIYGLTLTTDHHDELIKLGIVPSLKGSCMTQTHKFPNVMFCAPPTRNPDYPGEVREATLNWNGEGSFLFTSSSAPYDCNDNGSCDENTPVVPLGRSPKTDTLINVEKLVLEAGGCVDAASLSVTILKKNFHGRIFLGCDNSPLSRQEVMELFNKSGKYSKKFEGFTGTTGPLGKKLNNLKTCAELGWEPKYPSFAQFLETLK
ncbi:hypothetical protein PHJA_002767100 [Phtheirospermum japonicum]|uniref:Uncharacterized protein n=1 Tax=Phtheirospermum japonicum TaxID=374723 RepID=A0A830D263_9LAMI|nr:hypothetical protein PHJA_002767100 [Phtheirospermum japonicum]